jgi:hypothetical protein
MKQLRTSLLFGVLGPILLLILWLAGRFFPTQSDILLRPYGLFVWLGVLAASIILPAIAAIRSSKWWFLISGICLVVALWFFKALMA